jgi:methyltransferase (TIGR00027 family)
LQKGRFSRTAHGVAVRRAAHQLFDRPRVLDDPLAVPIVGVEALEKLCSSPKAQSSTARALRAFMAARSCNAEDQLAKAFERGGRQYVVLGAGLDTFAYRNPYPDLRVFEMDHPATQTWKRGRLEAAGIAVPQGLTGAAVDFERQTLAPGLALSGFDPNLPAFFYWLGVTPYRRRESCMARLGYIAKLPAGTSVAFDFAIEPKPLGWRQRLAFMCCRSGWRPRASRSNYSFARRNLRRNSPFRGSDTATSWELGTSTAAISATEPTDCGLVAIWEG